MDISTSVSNNNTPNQETYNYTYTHTEIGQGRRKGSNSSRKRGWWTLGAVTISTCSAYDCEFVALARDLQIPLITVDRQILNDFPETAISLDALVEPDYD